MKRILCVLWALVLLLGLNIPAAAQTLPLVVDHAQLLTESEDAELTEELERIRRDYGIDVVVLTVPTLAGQSTQSYADDYYDENGYGADGVLLLVDMQERQWYISTAGQCVYRVDAEELAEGFLDDLSAGRYCDAFLAFAAGCEKAIYIEQESDFILTDSDGVTQGSGAAGKTVLICLGIGLAVGLIVVLVMKSQLNTVKSQTGAANYVSERLNLTRSADMFLYHTTTRREKPKNNSTHTSSSGRSHGGGGGRF